MPKKKSVKFEDEEVDNESGCFKLGKHLKPITKKLIVKFRGSLNELGRNPNATRWIASSPEVFGLNDYDDNDDDDDDDEEVRQLLENALLISAKIKKIQSTFPCEISIDVKDIKQKNFVMSNGNSTHYLAYAGEINHMLDEILLMPSEKLNSQYLVDHAKYTPNRLMQDVIPIPKSKFSYVGKSNPLIKLINENSETLQLTITPNDLVDENYYKIENDVLHKCADRLREEFSNTFPMTNLREFEVKISRPNNLDFDDPTGITDNITTTVAADKVMNMIRELSCIIEITYAIPNIIE
jgi:hypothetical protein